MGRDAGRDAPGVHRDGEGRDSGRSREEADNLGEHVDCLEVKIFFKKCKDCSAVTKE